jgi:serine/threonine-protein kinase
MPEIAPRLTEALSDRYRLERELGQGGMATVYLAEDLRHHRKVAIKVIRQDLSEGMGAERFLREIRLAASLHHPNILPLYDSGEVDGHLYYVMPVAEGESLRNRLVRETSLPVADAVRLAREVADALDYAHRHEVVHRDIKPENIMLHEGHALITDFGIGKALSAANAGATLTQIGLAIGTPAYMSPEQAGGETALDGRSDLYSLGCVLYEMLAGAPPFTGPTIPAIIAKRFSSPPPDVTASRPSVPRAVADVARRLMAMEPGQRFATGAHAAEALAQSVTPSGTAAIERDSGATRSRSRLPWIAVLPIASKDAETADLADGLAEDITTGLSRFTHLQVIARQSASRVSATATDLRRVGEELGARYLIQGNIRRSGSRIRLSAQLVDAATGTHLWAETFDRELGPDGVFALQDELTDRIVATVADPFGILVRVMAQPLLARPVEELSASELCLRLYAHSQQLEPEEHARLRRGMELALEREPDHADTWAALATVYWGEKMHGLNPLPDPLVRARRAAERAIQIDSTCENGWASLAEVQYFSGDLAGFRQSADRARSLNPRNTSGLAMMAMLTAFSGDWDRGYEQMKQAMALNPHHGGWYHFVPFHYHFKRGEYAEALAAAKRINMPALPWSYTSLGIAYAALGRIQEAQEAADGFRRAFPGLVSAVNLDWAMGWIQDQELSRREGEMWRKALSGAAPETRAEAKSIAVLPFTNMSGSADDEYFSDGISEEIINALAQLPGLKVAARTSAFSFKGKNEDLRVVGEKLGVGTVLEGSVRRSGNRLRITAQLINVSDGYHLWSEKYDRELIDVFAVQDELASAIAGKLKLTLSGGTTLVKAPTQSLEAYELYLKGRVLLGQRGASLRQAIECFEKAVELDPGYAPAKGGLGESLALLGHYALVPAKSVMPRAKQLLEAALALNPDSPEILSALALVTLVWDGRREEARRLWLKALDLAPQFTQGRATYGCWLLGMVEGRWADARTELALAIASDPLSPLVRAQHGLILLMEGADAVPEARRAVEIGPDSYLAFWVLQQALIRAGHQDEAIAISERGLALSGRHAWMVGGLVAAYHRSGRNVEARACQDELLSRATREYIPCSILAATTAELGDVAEGLRLFEKAIEERETNVRTMSFLLPISTALTRHPEFAALADKMWEAR